MHQISLHHLESLNAKLNFQLVLTGKRAQKRDEIFLKNLHFFCGMKSEWLLGWTIQLFLVFSFFKAFALLLSQILFLKRDLPAVCLLEISSLFF